VKPTLQPTRSRPFEGVDVREAGAKGGRASGVSRRMAKQRRLEEAIFERSRNGYALLKLAEREARRNEALEEAIRRGREAAEREARVADFQVSDLLDEADELKAEIAKLEARETDLEQREAALRASIEASEHDLVDRLRALHEAGGLEPVLIALDLFDPVDELAEVSS
jgi:chromosome segregation ATPase